MVMAQRSEMGMAEVWYCGLSQSVLLVRKANHRTTKIQEAQTIHISSRTEVAANICKY